MKCSSTFSKPAVLGGTITYGCERNVGHFGRHRNGHQTWRSRQASQEATMAPAPQAIEIPMKPVIDDGAFATLETIRTWRTSVVPNWITAIAAVVIAVHQLV